MPCPPLGSASSTFPATVNATTVSSRVQSTTRIHLTHLEPEQVCVKWKKAKQQLMLSNHLSRPLISSNPKLKAWPILFIARLIPWTYSHAFTELPALNEDIHTYSLSVVRPFSVCKPLPHIWPQQLSSVWRKWDQVSMPKYSILQVPL